MLLSRVLAAGIHTREWNAGSLPAGVYLIRLQSGEQVQFRIAVLLK